MNKVTITLIFLIGALGFSQGACPNGCSGHGRCTNMDMAFEDIVANPLYHDRRVEASTVSDNGASSTVYKKDSCLCFLERDFTSSNSVAAWRGPDCSQKTCPYGQALGAHKRTNGVFTFGGSSPVTHSAILECSGVGTCDTKTGKCQCQPGYTGEACQRTSCPNDCSGFGVCTSLFDYVDKEVKDNDASYYVDFSAIAYNGFDKDSSRGCVCDSGRAGPDCSNKLCPSDADPMSGDGASKGRTCSGRGKCVDGVCKCFEGYFGTSCAQQRASNQQ